MTQPKFDYQARADLLKDRVILVTGAGSGLGRALSQACAAHGATVILLGRSVKKLEAVYDSIVDAGLTEPVIFPMDLEGAQWKDYQVMVDAIGREFGRLDGLVHNAAHFDGLQPLAEVRAPDWMKSLHINLNAPFFMTQLCLPLLEKSDDAVVLFVTDAAGSTGQAFWGSYGIAKAGLSSLARMWGKELKNNGIRVHTLDPGPVKTRLRELAYPAESTSTARAPESVTPAFLYLLGPEGRKARA